jgi:ribosome-associated protein
VKAKAPSKKTKATKPAPRKSAAKKVAARKVTTKKVVARKATVKKPAVRKPVARKPVMTAAPLRPVKPVAPRLVKAPATPKPELLSIIQSQLDDAKAEQITTVGLDGKSAIADFMVVASGRSSRHVGAIADQLVEKLKERGYRDLRIEGMPQCDWVLVDAGDVVVHLFRPEVRSFYNLEKLWSIHAPEERHA